MNRRTFLHALAGSAAAPRASGRASEGLFINASVAVGYDQRGRAISDNFIGLSRPETSRSWAFFAALALAACCVSVATAVNALFGAIPAIGLGSRA